MRRHHGQGRTSDAARGRGRARILPDVDAAAAAIAGRLQRTPLLSSETLGRSFGGRAFLKAELFQKTGSFKPRGMLAKLASLTDDERARGVVTVSAGNAAQALAWGCALEDVDCLVVMWQGASAAKIVATRAYGAAVDLGATQKEAAFERVEELRRETGRAFVHPYDDPVVIAGHASLGREIVEDLPDVDVVVVPVGGGGLISGITLGAPGRRVVGVEPRTSSALHEALAAGRPIPVESESIADALGAPLAGEHAVRICAEAGVESVLVTEAEIEDGFRFLYERAKLAAEPGAAVGVGALLAGKVRELDGATVAVVVSGGNVGRGTASAILKKVPEESDED